MVFRIVVSAVCVSAVSLAAAGAASAQYRMKRAPVISENYVVEGSLHYWSPAPDFIVQSAQLGIPGTEISAVDDLGFARGGLPDFKVVLKPASRFKLRFGYTPIKYQAESTLTRDIVFNAQRYSVGLPVNSNMEWRAWRAGLQVDVLAKDRGYIGVVLEAKLTDLRVDLASPLISEFTHVQAPIPTIGGAGRVYVASNFAISGELTGLSLTIDDNQGRYFDFDVNGTYYFTQNVGARFGVRRVTVFFQVEQDTGDLKLGGVYFGGVARF